MARTDLTSDSTASLTYCPTVVNGSRAPMARRAQPMWEPSCTGSSHIASALTHQPAERPVNALPSSATLLVAPPIAQKERPHSPPAGTSAPYEAEVVITWSLSSETN